MDHGKFRFGWKNQDTTVVDILSTPTSYAEVAELKTKIEKLESV